MDTCTPNMDDHIIIAEFTCETRNCKHSSLPSWAAKYTGVVPLSARLFTELEGGRRGGGGGGGGGRF